MPFIHGRALDYFERLITPIPSSASKYLCTYDIGNGPNSADNIFRMSEILFFHLQDLRLHRCSPDHFPELLNNSRFVYLNDLFLFDDG